MAKADGKVRRSPKKPGPKGTTEREIASAQRKGEALSLRKHGFDYRTIGQTLDPKCSAQNAHKLVMTALRELVPDQAEEVRDMMGAQLDDLLTGVWEKALKGDTFSIADAIKIMDRKAKLFGADAPARVALEGKNGGAIQTEATVTVRRIERVIVDPADPDATGVPATPGTGSV